MYTIVSEKCLQCGICTDSCPIGAILFEGHYLITEACTGCRICVTACPLGAIQAQINEPPEPGGFC